MLNSKESLNPKELMIPSSDVADVAMARCRLPSKWFCDSRRPRSTVLVSYQGKTFACTAWPMSLFSQNGSASGQCLQCLFADTVEVLDAQSTCDQPSSKGPSKVNSIASRTTTAAAKLKINSASVGQKHSSPSESWRDASPANYGLCTAERAAAQTQVAPGAFVTNAGSNHLHVHFVDNRSRAALHVHLSSTGSAKAKQEISRLQSRVKAALNGLVLKTGCRLRLRLSSGSAQKRTLLDVLDTTPPGYVRVSSSTAILLEAQQADQPADSALEVDTNLDSNELVLAGAALEAQEYVKTVVAMSVNKTVVGSSLALPRGVLLCGQSGVGKTALMRVLGSSAQHPGVHTRYFEISAAVLGAEGAGESERQAREIFERACAHADVGEGRVSVVGLDDIDSICPKRGPDSEGLSTRMVAQMLTLLDGASARSGVVVVATSRTPDAIDAALRRPGRLDREFSIAPPSPTARAAILSKLTSTLHLTPPDRAALALMARDRCIGFVGADLLALVRETLLRKYTAHPGTDPLGVTAKAPLDVGNILLSAKDFESSLKAMTRTFSNRHGHRSVDQNSGTSQSDAWDRIGGLANVKLRLQQTIMWPLLYADAFRKLGLKRDRGVLLSGPPGCGKTSLVRALAERSGATFLLLSGAEVFSAFVGDSEATIRDAFARARAATPSILFMDEVDAFVGQRSCTGGGDSMVQLRVLATLLTEMDGVETAKDVVVIGATNRPDLIDKALLRPGRFGQVVEVPLPSLAARQEILEIHSRKLDLDAKLQDPKERSDFLLTLAKLSAGLSGAELEHVCRESGLRALREDMTGQQVECRHFREALRQQLDQSDST